MHPFTILVSSRILLTICPANHRFRMSTSRCSHVRLAGYSLLNRKGRNYAACFQLGVDLAHGGAGVVLDAGKPSNEGTGQRVDRLVFRCGLVPLTDRRLGRPRLGFPHPSNLIYVGHVGRRHAQPLGENRVFLLMTRSNPSSRIRRSKMSPWLVSLSATMDRHPFRSAAECLLGPSLQEYPGAGFLQPNVVQQFNVFRCLGHIAFLPVVVSGLRRAATARTRRVSSWGECSAAGKGCQLQSAGFPSANGPGRGEDGVEQHLRVGGVTFAKTTMQVVAGGALMGGGR